MNQEFVKPLIKKANQIADNTADVKTTASHISRFWTQHMREEMAKHVKNGGAGLNALALQAMQQVMQEQKLA
jgi:NADH-dependant formate dehydrogenase delta subunit FdsD